MTDNIKKCPHTELMVPLDSPFFSVSYGAIVYMLHSAIWAPLKDLDESYQKIKASNDARIWFIDRVEQIAKEACENMPHNLTDKRICICKSYVGYENQWYKWAGG